MKILFVSRLTTHMKILCHAHENNPQVGQLHKIVTVVKQKGQKRELSLVVTHNDFMEMTGDFVELYAIKKHFKVERRGRF